MAWIPSKSMTFSKKSARAAKTAMVVKVVAMGKTKTVTVDKVTMGQEVAVSLMNMTGMGQVN